MEDLKVINKLLKEYTSLIKLADLMEKKNMTKELFDLDNELLLLNEILDLIMDDEFYYIIEEYYLGNECPEYICLKNYIDKETFKKERLRLLIRLNNYYKKIRP